MSSRREAGRALPCRPTRVEGLGRLDSEHDSKKISEAQESSIGESELPLAREVVTPHMLVCDTYLRHICAREAYLPLNVESSHCSVKSRTAPAMSDGRAATLHLVGGSAPQTRRARPESTAVVMRRPACVRGNLPWTECRANADPTTAITAAICVPRGGQLVPLGAGADLRWWGGLRGLEPATFGATIQGPHRSS